jgi:hypothetical protein
MRQHLGVGLRMELVTLLLELCTEGGIVLNDTIMYKGQLTGAVEMRVGILPGDFAMSRPAGVTDAGSSSDRILPDGFTEIINTTHLLTDRDNTLIEGSNSGRIVASVLQAAKSLQKDRDRLSTTDIAYNSTHKILI